MEQHDVEIGTRRDLVLYILLPIRPSPESLSSMRLYFGSISSSRFDYIVTAYIIRIIRFVINIFTVFGKKVRRAPPQFTSRHFLNCKKGALSLRINHTLIISDVLS